MHSLQAMTSIFSYWVFIVFVIFYNNLKKKSFITPFWRWSLWPRGPLIAFETRRSLTSCRFQSICLFFPISDVFHKYIFGIGIPRISWDSLGFGRILGIGIGIGIQFWKFWDWDWDWDSIWTFLGLGLGLGFIFSKRGIGIGIGIHFFLSWDWDWDWDSFADPWLQLTARIKKWLRPAFFLNEKYTSFFKPKLIFSYNNQKMRHILGPVRSWKSPAMCYRPWS